MKRRATARPGEAVMLGLWRLAKLRPDGVALFSATSDGLLASLAPGLALALVSFVRLAVDGAPSLGLLSLLQMMCAVLAAPVLSQLLLQAWRAEEGWLRYATVYAWSRWLLLALLVVLLGVAQTAAGFGVPLQLAVAVAILLLLLYAVRLHWLIARAALGIGRWRTLLLLLFVEIGAGIVVFGPALVAHVVQPGALPPTPPAATNGVPS